MDVWAEAMKIFTFGFSSVFFVLGVLSITVVITRIMIEKFADDPKKKK
jgi:hypothetical protein